jgi:sarcosine oxidase, subunit beta
MLAERGIRNVVLLEALTLGDGASSRAAGMVRAQGGTEAPIVLGMRTQEFYAASGERFPLDCGFVAQGYLMPCFSDDEVAQAHDRIALQQRLGLEVQWLSGSDIDDRNTGMAPGVTLGASYAPGDGYIDAPRNVLAYTAALTAHGVDVREHCTFTGLRTAGGRVVGVDTSDGAIDTEHVVLTGGPKLGKVGKAAGGRIPAGGSRHQVVVTAPVTAFDVHEVPMVFDVTSGIYWRPGEAGGLLWGMSNPDEAPGVAADFDEAYYQKARDRIEELLPGVKGLGLRRTWAATIDYTPDHLPILGPLITDDGPVEGTVVAGPAGHGMMWGPAVAEVAADLTLTGKCDWLDLTDLGLDRFDADGNSRLAPEPISLPFPEKAAIF